MGLHQPLMAALDPDDRLLHFALPKNIYHQAKRVFFYPGLEPPSNALFMNDTVKPHWLQARIHCASHINVS